MGVAEPKDLDGSRFAIKDEAAIESESGEGELHGFEFGEVTLGLLKIALQGCLFAAVGRFGEVGFQLFDFLRHGGDFIFHARNAAVLDVFARGFGRDDFYAGGPGTGIGLIALVVIPMEVGVDHVAHGLVRQFLDLLDERTGSGGLGVRVDNKNGVAEKDDGGVAVHLVSGLGDGSPDAIGDGLDVEEVFAAGGDREKQDC